jgi:hypothetical protein
MQRFLGVLVVAGVIGLARDAAPQSAPAVDVRTFTPSVDPRAGLVLEPSSTPGPWAFAAGAFLGFENDPVTLRASSSNAVVARPLEDAVDLDVVASMGLFRWGLLGVRAPFALAEVGSAGLPSGVLARGQVPPAAVGDVAFDAKATLIASPEGGFGLAALGEVGVPSGARSSFLADEGATVTGRLVADVATRAGSVAASVGYEGRTVHVVWPNPGGVVFGNAIPWAIGAEVRPSSLPYVRALDPAARQTWEIAFHGALPGGPVLPFGAGRAGSAEESPALVGVSDRVGLGHYRDAFAVAGVDVGLDGAVGVPTVRIILGFGFRFVDHDRDRDGIPDDADRCPDLAEDRDGFEDADGCPEADNDQDGVVDAEDACPNVAGARSSDPSKNGCPPDERPAEPRR